MCEPNHSIVQFPNEDDWGTPTESRLGAAVDNGVLGWCKKIGRWLHLSKMGKGHSEALGITPSWSSTSTLPDATFYEVEWWIRKVNLDGSFRTSMLSHTPEYWDSRRQIQQDAKDAAVKYAQAVSIGNLTTLRRFLETSIKKSSYASKYFQCFELMLTANGRDLFAKRFNDLRKSLGHVRDKNLDKYIKMTLGFTRKRHLLVPEWSDDSRLWTPITP